MRTLGTQRSSFRLRNFLNNKNIDINVVGPEHSVCAREWMKRQNSGAKNPSQKLKPPATRSKNDWRLYIGNKAADELTIDEHGQQQQKQHHQ